MAITPQGKAIEAGKKAAKNSTSFVKKHKWWFIGGGLAIAALVGYSVFSGDLGGQSGGAGNTGTQGGDTSSNGQTSGQTSSNSNTSPQGVSNPSSSSNTVNPSQVYGLVSQPELSAANNSSIIAPTYTVSYAPITTETASYSTPVNVSSEYQVNPELSNSNSYTNQQNPQLTSKTLTQQKLTVNQKQTQTNGLVNI